ncbi:MAG TPA: hypothetical protein VFL57_18645 [Bryobacteraceae bacterium]|nr:hypothetical protein [Bryobacteraceae bacterium]
MGPVSVAQGAAASIPPVDAANIGDGTLNLQLTSSATWLAAATGPARACALGGSCIPINFTAQTASLARGTYTALVTVRDAAAVDAPQTITVSVAVGGAIPERFEFFARPGSGPLTSIITANTLLTVVPTTATGGNWLAVTAGSGGSFQFPMRYTVTASPAGLGEGNYSGTLTISNSQLAADNRAIPVILRVTSQPIAAIPERLGLRLATNAAAQTIPISVPNRGGGTLNITGATAAGSPSWLTVNANQPAAGVVSLRLNPAGLQPGVYETTLTIASNAANAAQTIPLRFEVVAAGPPLAYAGGAVNNANFESGDLLAPGEIVALFGEQFTTGEPQLASSVPLPTELGGVRVLVHGMPAPLYYVSYGQINFQMPNEIGPGDAIIRVERGGQQGNAIGVALASRAPRILPTTEAFRQRWRRGDVVVLYAIGLGPTSPSVPTGAAAPSAEPLARVEGFRVRLGSTSPFGDGIDVIPDFVGLTPGFVGLYQINLPIPANSPVGDAVDLTLLGPDAGTSNRVTLAID